MKRRLLCLLMAAVMLFSLSACTGSRKEQEEPVTPETEKNGKVVILFTSDIHCAVTSGFGLDGVMQIRQTLESQGYTTLLVDNGDALQGGPIGTLSKGESVVGLMNAMNYDAAVPGNHEFDYGVDQFMKLAGMARYPFISCNFMKDGETVFADHIVVEAAGIRIGFVGVTTPCTFVSCRPEYFQNEAGEFIYSFLQDETGETVYDAVQKAADAARAEGADYVYVLGHLGNLSVCEPWTYVDIISNTRGIDAVLDGHSHDTDQVVMKNIDGEDVIRSACGTQLQCVGYSFIDPEKGIEKTGLWSWPNSETPRELLAVENTMTEVLDKAMEEFSEIQSTVIATTSVDLTIYDPVQKDSGGNPIRIVRRAETNLGDLVTDAVVAATGADIGLYNAGGIRADIKKGDITYADLMKVFPFGNTIVCVEATGQQVLDALEWGARGLPNDSGGFLQVSGISFEIDMGIASGCIADENGMCIGFSGERRVRGVMVGGEKLDLQKVYTVAANDYVLFSNGDGITCFDGCDVVIEQGKLDNQMLIEYISEVLGGDVGIQYADPYGHGRITVVNSAE